jgi:hypothetical protein
MLEWLQRGRVDERAAQAMRKGEEIRRTYLAHLVILMSRLPTIANATRQRYVHNAKNNPGTA